MADASGGGRILLPVFSALFSLAVILANYTLFEPLTVLQNLFNLVLGFLGGMVVGYHILLFMCRYLPMTGGIGSLCPGKIFLAVFLSVSAIDLGYLFFARFPGILTTDSYSTLAQIVEKNYNNTMPFWHTMTVLPFYRLGIALFGSANAGVALFHSAQILFMAACFGYAMMTMYQAGAPGWFLAAAYAIYALMPYNIVYSMTLWKDIPFAGAVLLFVTALYRALRNIGRSERANYWVLLTGAMGMSLWRTNGWFALLVTVFILLGPLRKRNKRLVWLLLGVLLVSWVLLNPVLDAMDVTPTNLVEAFAVPMQQVARVVSNGRELSQEQEALLSEAFWLDKLGRLYDPNTVDPVKFETFRYDSVEYIVQHWGDYLKLYVTLGLQYPEDYLKAWIEETKGYWNGGYFFWTYTLKLGENSFGIVHTGGDNFLARLYAAWFRWVEKPEILQPLVSIGLYVWVLAACCLTNWVNRRREWMLGVPLLVLVLGLILGTPVYSEFRYAYPLIVTLPLILCSTLFSVEPQASTVMRK